jgi:cell fate (sporulation/competence/biofilm development) regulator YmcA (YheA/YmcA/DUF963 family)
MALPGITNHIHDVFACGNWSNYTRRYLMGTRHCNGYCTHQNLVRGKINNLMWNTPPQQGFEQFYKRIQPQIRELLRQMKETGEIQDYKLRIRKLKSGATIKVFLKIKKGGVWSKNEVDYWLVGSKAFEEQEQRAKEVSEKMRGRVKVEYGE